MKELTLLKNFRANIDSIDQEILVLLGKRFQLSESIGLIKKEASLPILDESRWEEVLVSLKSKGKGEGLDEKFIEDIWNRIHIESISRQN